jgi:hypothetical protein
VRKLPFSLLRMLIRVNRKPPRQGNAEGGGGKAEIGKAQSRKGRQKSEIQGQLPQGSTKAISKPHQSANKACC